MATILLQMFVGNPGLVRCTSLTETGLLWKVEQKSPKTVYTALGPPRTVLSFILFTFESFAMYFNNSSKTLFLYKKCYKY